MKKIMTIFGTGPKTIKIAPLVKALEQEKMLEPIVIVTAQHREMLDSVLSTFKVRSRYDLNIMKSGQTLSEITSKSVTQLEQVIQLEEPDMALAYGDTMITFAGGLAAFYSQIPIEHVETELRSYDKYSPFPEEVNRQLVDVLAGLYFAPTENTASHLLSGGKYSESVIVTGNTAIDAMKYTVDGNHRSSIMDKYHDRKFILITAYRRENIGKPMENMFKAVRRLIDEYADLALVYPMCKNPRVREVAQKILGSHDRTELIEPLDVVDFHNFAKKSYFILADSDGIQEEASSFNKPVLVLRSITERPEGVEAGTLKVIGTDKQNVYRAVKGLIDGERLYHQTSEASNPCNDGFASEEVVNHIKYCLNLTAGKPNGF